jgi:hypothetical protein
VSAVETLAVSGVGSSRRPGANARKQLKITGKYGESDAEVLRYVFFTWWIGEFMHGPKHAAST